MNPYPHKEIIMLRKLIFARRFPLTADAIVKLNTAQYRTITL